MARAALKDMIEELRAEISASLAPGHNLSLDNTHAYVLRRTQRELYLAYDWPDLIIEERIPVPAGTRYVPLEEVNYEQVNEVWTLRNDQWYPLGYGIDPGHWNAYEENQRGAHISRYRPSPGKEDELELWPIPNTDTELLVRGQQKLQRLRAPDDRSTLDATLVVLFAAADLLTTQERADAAAKAGKAMNYLRSLRGNLISHKARVTGLTNSRPNTPLRPGLDYIPDAPVS